MFDEAANEQGDFQGMQVIEHSHLSYYRGLSLIELNRAEEAATLFKAIKDYALKEMEAEAQIEYFATSLPLLLVFEDDLTKVKNEKAQHLLALAEEGMYILDGN